MGFNKNFVWGTATASYQIEGAYNEGGRGLSIWDVFSHQPGNVLRGHTGDVACDHYHRFREDVALMRELGVSAYRLSVAWPRIFPSGVGQVNSEGVRFYSELLDELKNAGIEPYITLYHWDLPYELHKKGGWLNDDVVGWYSDYAAKVVELFSDKCKNYITFNEPSCFIGAGYLNGVHAPGYKVGYKDALQMCHNVLKSHGAAVIKMRAAAKSPIKIGYAPCTTVFYPLTESAEDIEAARIANFECPPLSEDILWNCSWWSDPIVLGKYPADGLEKYRDYLPEITDEDMKLINQPIDFYCQNIYEGAPVKSDGKGGYIKAPFKVGSAKTAIQWNITPEALRWGPKFLYERYKLPFFITENGMSAHDTVSLDGKVHDPNRIDYLHRYITELERAKDEGADVRGYFLWSLMDNFEWAKGYTDRFGIIYVDFETGERIPKDSYYWYRDWIKSHK
ncbi:MAG: beta-glucosidase [Clostridia bacterium]|nr:beta-glucosidase [Clostridia bacterium]